jgi:hypothetical protein
LTRHSFEVENPQAFHCKPILRIFNLELHSPDRRELFIAFENHFTRGQCREIAEEPLARGSSLFESSNDDNGMMLRSECEAYEVLKASLRG